MKKLWKPMLAVLLSMSLIAGWLALPASALGPGTTTLAIGANTWVLDAPAKTITFNAADFSAKGVYTGTSRGFVFHEHDPGSYDFTGNTVADIDLGIVNNTGLPLAYTTKFWMDMVLIDETVSLDPLDPSVVYSSASPYFTPSYSGATAGYLWGPVNPSPFRAGAYPFQRELDIFNYFDSGALKFPHAFFVEKFVDKTIDRTLVSPPVIQGTDCLALVSLASTNTAAKYHNGPFKSFNMQGSGPSPAQMVLPTENLPPAAPLPPVAPAAYDSLSGTIPAAAGSADDYLFHFIQPFEKPRFELPDHPSGLPGSGGWTTGHYPAIDSVRTWSWAASGWYWWDVIDTQLEDMKYSLKTNFKNSLGFTRTGHSLTPQPTSATGGIDLSYRVWYEIEATVQAVVKFTTDDAGTLPCTFTSGAVTLPIPNWEVDVDTQVKDEGALPTPDAPAGQHFVNWKYFDGANWVIVDDDFEFDTAKVYVFVANFAPDTPTDPEPVRVQVKVNGQLFPSGQPFLWDSSVDTSKTVEQKLAEEQLLSLIEGMKDGKLWLIPKGQQGNPANWLEVGVDTIDWNDPEHYDVDKVDGVYTFYLVAENQVGIDTLVRFFLDDGTTATRTPYIKTGETDPYEAWVRAYDTVAGQSGAGKVFPAEGLPTPPPKADGSVFSHWVYVLTPVGGGTPTRIEVKPDFQFDPRAIALNLPKRTDFNPALPLVANRDDAYYVCDLYAEYKPATVTPPGSSCPWWLIPLAGILPLGGGVVIAGMTLPWLIALPVLPILLLCGGKLISREKPAEKKEIVTPPKTGENSMWALLPLAGIGLAGAWLVVLRRRREEEEYA